MRLTGGEHLESAAAPTSATPPYVAPTFYPFAEIVPGVTGVATAPAAAPVGSDTGGCHRADHR